MEVPKDQITTLLEHNLFGSAQMLVIEKKKRKTHLILPSFQHQRHWIAALFLSFFVCFYFSYCRIPFHVSLSLSCIVCSLIFEFCWKAQMPSRFCGGTSVWVYPKFQQEGILWFCNGFGVEWNTTQYAFFFVPFFSPLEMDQPAFLRRPIANRVERIY